MCLNYPSQFMKIVKSNRKECWYTCSSINLFHFLRSTFISLSINPKNRYKYFSQERNAIFYSLYRQLCRCIIISCFNIDFDDCMLVYNIANDAIWMLFIVAVHCIICCYLHVLHASLSKQIMIKIYFHSEESRKWLCQCWNCVYVWLLEKERDGNSVKWRNRKKNMKKEENIFSLIIISCFEKLKCTLSIQKRAFYWI